MLWCVMEEVKTLLSSWTCDLAQEVSEHSADFVTQRGGREVLPIYIWPCNKKRDLVAMETAQRCCWSSVTGLQVLQNVRALTRCRFHTSQNCLLLFASFNTAVRNRFLATQREGGRWYSKVCFFSER